MLLSNFIPHPIRLVALVASALGLSSAQLATGQSAPKPPVVAAPATAPRSPDSKTPPVGGQDMSVAVSDLSSLDRLLPVGKTALRVTVPTVDEEGHLTSVITMGSITRLDEENFRLEKVVLTSFEPAAAPDEEGVDRTTTAPEETVIRLVEATYHAPTRVLVSEKPVTVRKPTIFLSGSSLHYDSAVGRAVMKGETRAILSELAPPEPMDEPTEEPLDDEDGEMSPEPDPPAAPANPQRP